MKQVNFLLIISIFLIFSCQDTKDIITNRNQRIILNSIDTLMRADELYNKSDFIVNPYCGPFEFNNYSNTYYSQYGGIYDGSKEEVLKYLGWNDSIYNNVKSEIDSIYSGKCYEKSVNNLSHTSSTLLITFSAIYKDLAFVEIIEFCDPIIIEELNSDKDYLKRPRSNISSLVLLFENEKVKKIFTDNYISLEMQCE